MFPLSLYDITTSRWFGIHYHLNNLKDNVECRIKGILLAETNYCYVILAGKVGGFLASIPQVMVAALLCFMWAMLAALGLSNLRYSEAGSSRNIIIVGLSLFFSLSIPAYFQQYGISPNSNLSVPSYFQPYIVASHGPFRSKYGGVCFHLTFCNKKHLFGMYLPFPVEW